MITHEDLGLFYNYQANINKNALYESRFFITSSSLTWDKCQFYFKEYHIPDLCGIKSCHE